MTIQTTFIPDGLSKLPVGAIYGTEMAAHLENSGYSEWRSVERIIYGSRTKIELRLDGNLSDYQQSDLDTVSGAIVGNINGLKEHPEGWHEVQSDQ